MADEGEDEIDHQQLSQLAQVAAKGDRLAAADLLRALQDVIYRFALNQLRNRDSAVEVTQETGLRLLQSLSRYEGRGKVTTWALGVTLNVCREQRRKQKKAMGALTSEDLITSDPASAFVAEQREDAERLRAEMIHLAPRQREAVSLRYFEGLSVEETAQAMGCSNGAVKASVWQALRRLRIALSTSEEISR